METTSRLQRIFIGILQGAAGFVCSMVCVLDHYPLVPAFFAANCLLQEHSVFLYIGMIVGIGYFMPLGMIVKYIVILVVVALAIRFYMWANKNCGGFAAGIIAGAITVMLNFSGHTLSAADRSELITGISEGVIVMGLTILFHYAFTMLTELQISFFRKEEEDFPGESAPGEGDGRMLAFASAVDGLSLAFANMGRETENSLTENMSVLEREITGKLCASCEGCAICWNENQLSLSGKIRNLLQAVAAHETKDEILKNKYVTDCPRYPHMVEEAVNAFGRMELNQAWYKRLLENRMVIAQQLDAMSDLLEDFTRQDRRVDAKSRVLLAKISFEIKERGLLAEELHIYEDAEKRKNVKARVSSKWGGGIPSRNYLRALEKAMHMPMRLEMEAKSVLTKEVVSLTAYEDTRYYTMQGIAGKKKNGSSVSGDSFAMFGMDNGKYYVALSDGMGSGGQANMESEMVVDLLQKFLEAGFQKDTAIRMMNSAMVLKGENDSYSTLDLADIDLYSGSLELTKIGSAATFIKHGEDVECMTSTSLPAGAYPDPEPENRKVPLQDGDFLVMMTDGVLEYLHVKNPEAKMKELLADIDTDNAGVLAKKLLEKTLFITGNYAMDDMTILAVGIWEK